MPSLPIAIVGAACRLPGAPDLEAFWSLLMAGRDAVTQVTEDRFSTRFFGHPRASEAGKSYVWSAGMLEDVAAFDPGFFGISAREAVQMDPQQRLLLELAWEAVEDSGLTAASLRGQAGAVYVGASGTDYANRRFADPSSADAYFMTGNTLSIFSNRISYILDLHGPSLTVDTACSSSLVALHLACEDLRNDRAPFVLVGGVNLLLSPFPFIGFSRASMLSKRGRCFSFDARGDGYVRGEGGGVVLLKRLDQAVRDGDRIRGIIMASGVNSDGRTVGLSLPNREAQTALLDQLYGEAGIDPDALSFVEAHGTGTAAGDPLEAGALGTVLGRRRSRTLPIGSVKSNIGHLEAASGMAGLLKAMLALERRVLPPSINFETPNPDIPFADLNLRVADEPIVLPARKRMAGVSGFGFGGTNAHIVLAQPPAASAEPVAPAGAPAPLLLSARSEPALRALAGRWAETLAEAPEARADGLVRSAARARDHHHFRAALVDPADPVALAALADYAAGELPSAVVTDSAVRDGRIAFVFSGNGAQWDGMGREALALNPVFRAAVTELDALMTPLLGWSVLAALEGTVPADLGQTDVAQPLLFAVQVGVVAALAAEGIEPAATIGHSVGEIPAAWASGALSLAEAARLVVVRSRHQHRTAGAGRMAVLGASPEDALDAIRSLSLGLEIAAVNGPTALTVAGPAADIETLGPAAKARGWSFSALDLDYAFHTAAMEPVRDGLLQDLRTLAPTAGRHPFVSTVTGGRLAGTSLDGDYWWRNIRETVQFADGIAHLAEDGVELFLEIGPRPVLQSYVRDVLRGVERPGRPLGTLARKPAGADPFPRLAAQCYAAGYDLAAAPRFDGPVERTGLPSYPWQRERFWIDLTAEGMDSGRPIFDHPLLGFRKAPGAVEWTNILDTTLFPWLEDHKLDQSAVLPAAAVIEIALAAAHQRFPDAAGIEVRDLEIRRPIPLEAARARETMFRLQPETGHFDLMSRARLAGEDWSHHAVGRIVVADAEVPAPIATGIIRRTIDAATLYALADALGLHYGPEFRPVNGVEIAEDGSATVRLLPETEGGGEFLIDPRRLDGVFQGLLGLLADLVPRAADGTVLLPWRFDAIRLLGGSPVRVAAASLRLRRATPRAAAADIVLHDEDGNAVAVLNGAWFRAATVKRPPALEDRTFHVEQVPAPLDAAVPAPLQLAKPGEEAEETETGLLLAAMVAAAAHRALSPLLPSDRDVSLDSLVESGALAADALPLAADLLELLRRHEAASESYGTWRLAAESGLPSPEEIWRSLFYGAPELAALTGLLARAVEALPETLANGPQAGLIMPSLRQLLLLGEPFGSRIVAALENSVASLAAALPAGRKLRILEIGAGAGLVARRLVPALVRRGFAISYVATDAAEEAVAQLVPVLMPFQQARVVRWDPANADDDETLPAGGFDLVVGAYPLTFGELDDAALRRVAARLVPGGRLALVEPAPSPALDFLFGQTPGWWRDGVAAGFPISALRGLGEWRGVLVGAGFPVAGAASLPGDPWPLTLVEASLAPAATEPRAIGPVVLVADDGADPLADALVAALGTAVQRIRADGVAVLDADSSVVILPSAAPLATHLGFVAAISRRAAEANAPVWLVTRGEGDDPSGGATIGFGRVIANEMPTVSCRRIELSLALGAGDAAEAILSELRAADGEREARWTPAGRTVPRVRRGLPASAGGGPVRLALKEPGFLDSLRWNRQEKAEPGPGQVSIAVEAAGLNFRDVMWGMGLLPDEALLDGFAGATLGMECAGIVEAVGPGVDHVAPGDKVMAFAPASFASFVTTRAECVASLAEGIDFAAGATIPVAFLTVLYSLSRLGRLQAGERVLIHGGAGAVGLAAVQYAQHVGAEIFATAGSPAKRALLRASGVEHVLDSRSLRFADEIMTLTSGEGVDVVLNSLGGEAMERSLGLLRPFGRFLELGKRDFYLNTRIGLRPVRHNVSYFAIDADELVARHPAVARSLLDELQALFASGDLKPLPYLSLPFSEISEAFRLMRASGHIGKIVLTPDAGAVPAPEYPTEIALRPDRSFVVVGGLSGFGLATARWLVKSGVRHVALVSRSGANAPGARAALDALREAGAETASAFAADVADEAALGRTLAEIRRAMPPIGGIIHAAMVVEDGLVATLDAAGIDRVLRPKLVGAENLDRLTRQDPVDLFLLFSSATTLLGAPGQGSYVAANMALEALAKRRQADGLPALAVAWGPIADAGYLADHPAAREALARRLGAVPLASAGALASLPALIASGLPTVTLAEVNWGAGKGHLPVLSEALFEGVAAQAEARGATVDMAELLAGKSPEEVKEIVQGLLLDEIAGILRVARGKLDPNRPLSEFGMDSLMAVELRIAVERRLGVEIPALMLNDSVTLAVMATRIARSLGDPAQGGEDVSVMIRHETADESEAASLAETLLPDREAAMGTTR